MFSKIGASKFGAFVLGGSSGCVSGTPKEIMSTILETSFLIFSGRTVGISLPVNRRLQRYMAKANSGKNKSPDLVVSDNTLLIVRLGKKKKKKGKRKRKERTYHILDRSLPDRCDRNKRSLAFSPIVHSQ